MTVGVEIMTIYRVIIWTPYVIYDRIQGAGTVKDRCGVFEGSVLIGQ